MLLLAAALVPLASAAQSPFRLTNVGVALVIAFLVISLGLHEAAHGWVAWKCGDPTARDLGRISLNPLVHIDPFMTVILPVFLYYTTGFIFGGAKPVPVAFHRLRNPLRDMSLVALAGPASNFLLAILFLLVWKIVISAELYAPDQLLPQVMQASMYLNLLLAVFNLVPIPPLDGSRVMTWLLPASMRAPYIALERFGILLIMGLILFVDPFAQFLFSGIQSTFNVIDVITGGQW